MGLGRQQLLPAMTRPQTQLQSFQLDPTLLREQLLLSTDTFAHGQRVQLVAHGIPHPYQHLPMPNQLRQIPLFQARPPHQKIIFTEN